jgi:tripeptidyl-peptidase-1
MILKASCFQNACSALEGPYDVFAKPLQCGIFAPTNVISISYGSDEDSVPLTHQKRQCNEFSKLGLQGVSFITGSGDRGVGRRNWVPLRYPVENFQPDWPASCPWVTTVGATVIDSGRTVHDPESAAPFSGGGFSNVHPRPRYQQASVDTFFAEHEPA